MAAVSMTQPKSSPRSEEKVDITLEGLPYELCSSGPDDGQDNANATKSPTRNHEPALSLSPRSSRSATPVLSRRKRSSNSSGEPDCNTLPTTPKLGSSSSLSPLSVKRGVQLFRSDSGSSVSSNSSACLSPLCGRVSRGSVFSSGGSDSTFPSNGIDLKTGQLKYVTGYTDEPLENAPTVYVKVMGNAYEHHAQIYTDTDFLHQLDYISLRNCEIGLDRADPTCINIEDRDGDVPVRTVRFIAGSEAEAAVWVKALIPRDKLPAMSDLSPVFNRQCVCNAERKQSA